jgi:PPOX class probable F420-dependent enzyme
MSAALVPLRNSKTILLTTYKRDGTAVGTPVSIAFDGDRAFFRSYDKAWKTRRLRHNPLVQAAPSTFRGKPTGPAVPARATL